MNWNGTSDPLRRRQHVPIEDVNHNLVDVLERIRKFGLEERVIFYFNDKQKIWSIIDIINKGMRGYRKLLFD